MPHSRESINELRAAILKQFGRVDVLVNAAGQTFREATHTVSEDDWNGVMDVNLTGTLRACQSFYEPLVESGRGRVINIASLSSYVGMMEVTAYGASKSAVLGLTRSLAVSGQQRRKREHNCARHFSNGAEFRSLTVPIAATNCSGARL